MIYERTTKRHQGPQADDAPLALKAVRKGGRAVRAGIQMNDIPRFPHRLLPDEGLRPPVANLPRQDGLDFSGQVPQMDIVTPRPLVTQRKRPTTLADLRGARFEGAALPISPVEVSHRTDHRVPAAQSERL